MGALMSEMRLRVKNRVRKVVSVGLSALLVLCLAPTNIAPADAADATASSGSAGGSSSGLSVAYRTQAEISKVLEAVWNLDYAAEYSEEPQTSAPYSAGKLVDKTQQNALAFLNAIRYVAGLNSNVQLKDEYCIYAQACALVNDVNGELSHYPKKPEGMDDTLYQTGCVGANKGNLVMGTKNFRRALLLLVDDQGVSSLGHRRWILFPGMEYTGFGMVENYSSMYAHDNFTNATVSADPGVVWPAQNMPLELWQDGATWSASFGRTLDRENVTVSISSNNGSETWEISDNGGDGSLSVSNENYGQPGCVMFTPKSIQCKAGESYHVIIKENGTLLAEYDVNFFNALATSSDSGSGSGNTGSDQSKDDGNQSATADEIETLKTIPVADLARESAMNSYTSKFFSVYFSWNGGMGSSAGSASAAGKFSTDEYNYYVNGNFVGYTTIDDFDESENKFVVRLDSDYSGLKRGRGYTFSVEPDFWVNQKHVTGEVTSIKFATKPYKVTGMTVKAASGKSASGKAIVKWSKKTGSGYQVQIATNSTFTKGKKTYKITNSSTLKKTISGLKAGKKYYVRVRAYKTYGNTAYGDWSNVRSVRI